MYPLIWLHPGQADEPFPHPDRALSEPNGLLAAGGDLSLPRLLRAYRQGIFPWYEAGQPILWWSPDPRTVLFCDQVRISRSLRKTLRSGRFRLSFDEAFRQVIRGCAEPRGGVHGTWITYGMQQAFVQLHEAGHAHSVEVWQDGALVGGSTVSRSGGCSTASPCSAASVTPPRWPWSPCAGTWSTGLSPHRLSDPVGASHPHGCPSHVPTRVPQVAGRTVRAAAPRAVGDRSAASVSALAPGRRVRGSPLRPRSGPFGRLKEEGGRLNDGVIP
jgi:hypothetical protein